MVECGSQTAPHHSITVQNFSFLRFFFAEDESAIRIRKKWPKWKMKIRNVLEGRIICYAWKHAHCVKWKDFDNIVMSEINEEKDFDWCRCCERKILKYSVFFFFFVLSKSLLESAKAKSFCAVFDPEKSFYMSNLHSLLSFLFCIYYYRCWTSFEPCTPFLYYYNIYLSILSASDIFFFFFIVSILYVPVWNGLINKKSIKTMAEHQWKQ